MKSLFVSLAVIGLALTVNASGTSSANVPQHMRSFTPFIPMCPPGEHAVLVNVNGHLVFECVPY
ncbi:hypothetical protein [Dyella flagellata]|uniref:Secreted protein n=1 Tax=Dyella flagellata TaxID=1867833 RepID=A0ABQ5XHC5_9GAMM|nr:hypothetical protein [Dyella flagellata]GLQ90982.1 hypothetical protein GCM10007898_45580 [Dyella flagellata]